ncbi:MAG: hypothetical protein IPK07_09400 [Deltaproteobacteria bacterium]|nr:hypothetical protein [Deltaproteobacteria bacterium]
MRSRATILALASAFAIVALTGLPLVVDPVYDRFYFRCVIVHLVLGLALLPLYYVAVIRHLLQILGRYRAWMVVALLLPITFLGGIGPPFVSPWHNPLFPRFAVLELAIYLWLRKGRRVFGRTLPPLRLFTPLDPGESWVSVWTGVGALVASWLMLHTGFALVLADFKFANDKYFVHGPVAMALMPLVILHFATPGWRFARRPGRLGVSFVVTLSVASVVLFAGSLRKNLSPLDHLPGDERVRVRAAGVLPVAPAPLAPEHAAILRDSSPCQACHDEVAERWAISSHRFAGMNKLYLVLLAEVERDLGAAGVRYCDNCHDPVVALTVKHDQRFSAPTIAASEGVSCKVCHFLEPEEHPAGNGAYPLVMIKGLGFPGAIDDLSAMSGLARHMVSYDSRLHIRAVRRPYYREPEGCRPCHVIEIPAALNGAADFELTPLYASFGRFEHREVARCRECHMTNVDRDRTAYRQWDHRFPGSNTGLSLLVPAEHRDEARKMDVFADAFLRGDMANRGDDEDIRRDHPLVAKLLWDGSHLPTTVSAEALAADPASGAPARLRALVRTTSATIGHDFPVDLADQVDVWLELRVVDGSGRSVFASGVLGADGHLPPETRTLSTTFLDRAGRVVDQHQIWRFASHRERRFVAPGGSHDELFFVPLGGDEVPPLAVTARWLFRRVNQPLADWLFGDGTTFPVTELARAEATVP